jgi:dipeptidyl aminopeptidase/acylaminoacyl peptidase
MRRKFRYLYHVVFVLSAVMSVGTSVAAQTGLPPLIDREIFFGNPEIATPSISPDGKFIAFRKPYKDTMNIWVKRADEPFEKGKLVTAETKRPIRNSFWSRDSKYILFVNDVGGDENFNVFAVDPSASPAAGSEVPVTRNLTDMKKVRALIYGVPRTEPDAIYVGLNDRDPRWHDLYKVKISTGERQLLQKNTERFDGYRFDNSGRLRLATRTTQTGDVETLSLNADGTSTKIYSCNVFETCNPIRFHTDNKRIYFITNTGEANLVRLSLFDPETKKEEPIESDPMNRVDLSATRFSDVTDELIFTVYQDDKPRLYFKDKGFGADYKLIRQKVGQKELSFGSTTTDETRWIVTAWSDTDPGDTFLFDRKTKELTKQYRVLERLPREALAEMRPIHYKSSDGLEVPAYLTLPKGVPAKNLPTIIIPHGGPWARDVWGSNQYAQFAANRGYAVLQPNFRGSTGYGKKFIDAGNKQWGDKMQDDLTWGVKYLIAEGIADPKRIGIWGASYGGYATLAGITFTPDLYAAAVAEVAPVNQKGGSFAGAWEKKVPRMSIAVNNRKRVRIRQAQPGL